jgi:uncharacterized RDD family membrane protein YckC
MITLIEPSPAPASLFKRFVAYILDAALLYFPTVILTKLILAYTSITYGAPQISVNSLLFPILLTYIVSICMYIIYFSILESTCWQASIGKKCLRLYVAKKDNTQLTFVRSFLRAFTYYFITSLQVILMFMLIALLRAWLTCLDLSDATIKSLFIALDKAQQYNLGSESLFVNLFRALIVVFAVASILLSLLCLILPYITAFFTKEKKTVYDMITGTRVHTKLKVEVGEPTLKSHH